MAEIQLQKLTKIYGDGTRAVSALDLDIADGEFVVLVGPSGCGKTTALRMVAGLEPITEGTVRIGERVVNDLPPKNRDIAMIFQNYALYPHMSAFKNMAFGLKMRRLPKDEINKRVPAAAKVLGLAEVLGKRPRTLSGGQRQRVAMGRAIVREPQAFLMDEPLSNLDAKLRVEMRAEIARIQRDLDVTTIYVTHDQTEAMTLGDRVAVMSRGLLQQVAPPQQLYDEPVNLFVAEFIGSPAMNVVEATLERVNGTVEVRFGENRLRLADETLRRRPALRGFEDRPVVLGLRPEDMEDASLVSDSPAETRFAAVVDIREDMGSEVFVHFGAGAPPVRTDEVREAVGADALEATSERAEEGGSPFVARLDRMTRVSEGERIELAVTTERLHFFDPETGQAIYGEAEQGTPAVVETSGH
ncbi:MAG: sn-glycerol-3-phosphate ABC transporter ATP-binding protein UgpC [Actinobacteria bacterium]|nr:sn-glycerol-3-phosphate ABC transporter ATP-binding protein UgpC [Actinomycetota bacterium]